MRGAAAGDTPMKQLQEIVAEILEERKTEFERIVGGPIGAVDAGNPDILRALLNDGFNRRQRVQQRIKEDPALAKLINAMLPAFVLIGASQIPADEKGRVCVQFLVELVEIWEEAIPSADLQAMWLFGTNPSDAGTTQTHARDANRQVDIENGPPVNVLR